MADCVSKCPSPPSGPSKKRLRGSEHHHDVQTLTPRGSSHAESHSLDVEVTSQRQLRESEEESNCCSGVKPGCQEAIPPVAECVGGCQGFVLTGLHSCGDLSATLLRHFVNCPHVRGITSVACCYMKITTKENPTPPGVVEPSVPTYPGQESPPAEFGYPMSSWIQELPGHQLSYKAREGACHAMEDYIRRLREESQLLRTHCYRAMLETFIRDARPGLRRAGIQTIKKAHLLPFTE